MITTLDQPGLQQRTLRLYGEFLCRRSAWLGQLAVAVYDGAAKSGLAAAASLVGAVSLTVDSEAAEMKAHFRDGAFDFLVNTLDEALRAMKNEVRKQRPIAIGVIGQPNVMLAEAANRGLLAAFIVSQSGQAVSPQAGVADPGTTWIHVSEAASSSTLRGWLEERKWAPVSVPVSSLAGITPFVEHDAVRRRWMKDLAIHQRSASLGERSVWLSEEERQALTIPGSLFDNAEYL